MRKETITQVKNLPALEPGTRRRIIECGKYRLKLGRKVLVMAIVNLTSDSFSGNGMYQERTVPRRAKKKRFPRKKELEKILARARQMAAEGADIIDVGGESTRPGALQVSAGEEIERVVPAITRLAEEINLPISVDTSKAEVARQAVEAGAVIINDITGLKGDQGMAAVAARYEVPVVVMHIKGTPRTMQRCPRYKALIPEIMASLRESIGIARSAGVADKKIIVDPGIGFGKTTNHNLEIIRNLAEFKSLGYPVLIGVSRKSFIGNVLGLSVEERIFGTAASVALAIINGADIVRVHDVREMAQVVRMVEAIRGV